MYSEIFYDFISQVLWPFLRLCQNVSGEGLGAFVASWRTCFRSILFSLTRQSGHTSGDSLACILDLYLNFTEFLRFYVTGFMTFYEVVPERFLGEGLGAFVAPWWARWAGINLPQLMWTGIMPIVGQEGGPRTSGMFYF